MSRFLNSYQYSLLEFLQYNEVSRAIDLLPEGSCVPFLPIVGRNYGNATKRVLFLGQDVGDWSLNPSRLTTESIYQFSNDRLDDQSGFLEPTTAKNFYKWYLEDGLFFWDLPVRFMLALNGFEHGKRDKIAWKDYLKKNHMILSSMAWGSCNSLVTPSVARKLAKRQKAPFDSDEYQKVSRVASWIFDKLSLHIDGLRPDIVVILARARKGFFEGMDLEWNDLEGGLIRSSIHRNRTLIYHTYHPSYLRRLFRQEHNQKYSTESVVDAMLEEL